MSQCTSLEPQIINGMGVPTIFVQGRPPAPSTASRPRLFDLHHPIWLCDSKGRSAAAHLGPLSRLTARPNIDLIALIIPVGSFVDPLKSRDGEFDSSEAP